MKLALIAHYLGPSLGIGQYLNRLVPELVAELEQRGADVVVLGSPNAVANSTSLAELGSRLRVMPELDYPAPRRYAWFAARFSSFCRHNRIHATAWLSNPIVFPWHPPSIAVLHDVNEWKNRDKGRLRTRLRSLVYLDASLRFARKIVAISAATRDDIDHFRPWVGKQGKLETILNGMDSSLPSLDPVDIPAPTAPFLLSVGRIDPVGKRLLEAYRFVEILRQLDQQPWELHLVGGMNQSTAQRGQAFLDSVADVPWVSYHGHVDNPSLAQWYRQCSAVIFLSRDEGFGLPVAEAASFEKPIVVNADNKASLEVGGGNVHAIDLEQLDEGAREFLSPSTPRGSRATPSELPSWQAAARRYSDLLIELGGAAT